MMTSEIPTKKNVALALEDICNAQDISEIASNSLHLITCLQNKHLINTRELCVSCDQPMALVMRKNTKGQYGFLCKKCHVVTPLSRGTFFEKNKMSYEGVLLTLFAWVCHIKARSTAALFGMTIPKVFKQYQCFREICTMKLVSTPIRIGGPGEIVEVDENMYTMPPKEEDPKELKQKIVGMYAHSTNLGLVILIDYNKQGENLLTHIIRHVVPGTTIWSNNLKDLQELPLLGYQHATFQQSAGAHIEYLRHYWASVKTYLRNNCNIKADQITSDFLNEYMWMGQYGNTHLQAFHNMLEHIAEFYPVNQLKKTDIVKNPENTQ